MNFVALALLEACGGDDENAFWILAGMCENLELEVRFRGFHPGRNTNYSVSRCGCLWYELHAPLQPTALAIPRRYAGVASRYKNCTAL